MDFITFSRQLGSGGAAMAKEVAERLGYNFIDNRAIEDVAKEMGFLESVMQVDEKIPSFFRRFFSHTPSINLDRLNSVMYELARQGDAVFLGRGGQILLKSFDCALHVRVIASKKKRIQNLVERGYSKEGASHAIGESDHERRGFIKFAFGVDWDNPEIYDLVLNMDKLPLSLAVQTVINMAQSRDMKVNTVDAVESLEKLALINRVEAELVESGVSYGPASAISVAVDKPGKIRLGGIAEDEYMKVRAEEVAKKVKGVEKIENLIRVRPADRHA